jgi:hypothetical protein
VVNIINACRERTGKERGMRDKSLLEFFSYTADPRIKDPAIMSPRTPVSFDAEPRNPATDANIRIFGEKFLSFAIRKSVNVSTEKNHPDISVRSAKPYLRRGYPEITQSAPKNERSSFSPNFLKSIKEQNPRPKKKRMLMVTNEEYTESVG